MMPDTPTTDVNTAPSWDAAREGAPPRPEFISSLPEQMFVARPKRVIIAWVVVFAGVIGVLIVIASAAFRIDALRDTMLAALPEDMTEEYAEADIQRAADVILAAIGGLSVLVALGQLLSMSALAARRSTAARLVFIVLTALSVPVTLLTIIVGEGGTPVIVMNAMIVCGMFTAAVMICTTPVSTWLRQSEERRTVPLLPSGSEVSDQRR